MRENYFGTIRVFQQIFVAFSHKTNCENETFFETSRMMIKVLKIQKKNMQLLLSLCFSIPSIIHSEIARI